MAGRTLQRSLLEWRGNTLDRVRNLRSRSARERSPSRRPGRRLADRVAEVAGGVADLKTAVGDLKSGRRPRWRPAATQVGEERPGWHRGLSTRVDDGLVSTTRGWADRPQPPAPPPTRSTPARSSAFSTRRPVPFTPPPTSEPPHFRISTRFARSLSWVAHMSPVCCVCVVVLKWRETNSPCNFYPRAGRRFTPCRLRPAPRTPNQFSSAQLGATAEVDTDGNGRIARLPLLGGAALPR